MVRACTGAVQVSSRIAVLAELGDELASTGRILGIELRDIERESHLSLVVFNNFMNTKYHQSASTNNPTVFRSRGERTQPTYHMSTVPLLRSNGYDTKESMFRALIGKFEYRRVVGEWCSHLSPMF